MSLFIVWFYAKSTLVCHPVHSYDAWQAYLVYMFDLRAHQNNIHFQELCSLISLASKIGEEFFHSFVQKHFQLSILLPGPMLGLRDTMMKKDFGSVFEDLKVQFKREN